MAVLRSKNLTLELEQCKYSKYLPYAFTEQGIYMLMTVLKGELATKQSKALPPKMQETRRLPSARLQTAHFTTLWLTHWLGTRCWFYHRPRVDTRLVSRQNGTPHRAGRAGKAKNRGSARPKDGLSGLRLRAGRDASAERLPSERRHSPP